MARRSATKGVGGEQIEGRQAVRELLLAASRRVTELYVSAESDAPIVAEILELAEESRVSIHQVSRTKLDSMAASDAPQGVLARAAELDEVELDDLATGRARSASAFEQLPFLLALDGVTDPGNLGAIMRSALSAGVTGIVLPKHRAVHITPTVAKAAAGAVEHLPIALVGGIPAALTRMSELGVWSVGLDSEGDKPLWDLGPVDVPLVVVVGAEGAGLSRLVRQRCDQVVSIPMQGPLDSLNAATAGAIACFEVARRRSLLD